MTKKTKCLSLFLSLCLIFSVFTFPHASAFDEIIDGGTTQPIKILTADEVPFALDFQAMRQAGHVDRLATQETLLNEVLFANDDDSLTSYYFGVPIKYVDSDGAIKDKDNTIVQRNDMKYTTAANDVKAVLPQNISEGVTLEYNDYIVRCLPYVNSDVSVMSGESLTAASASAVLNTVNPKANNVQYNAVFNNKSSIVYTPTFMGIKEDIILTEYTGNIFRFRIEANGLVPQVQQDGRILLNNAQNEAVFEISPIVLVDANGKICLNNSQSMTQLSDGAYLYTVTANEEFLTDESTAYPVAVDPSFSISYDCEYGIDAYTLCLGENSGYYQSEYLPVGITTDMYGSEIDEYRSFIQLPFMTSSFFSTNYQYATIEAVYLYLSASSTGSGSVSAHLVAPSSYTGTVLDNFARYVQTPIQSISSTTAWNDYFIDITDEAMLWKNGTATWNYPEIMLKSTGMHNFCSPYYFPEYAPCVSVRFYNTVESVYIEQPNHSVYLPSTGDTYTVRYTLFPSMYINDSVTFSSSNSNVATVSVYGVVTAQGNGTCEITVKSVSGSRTDTIQICVGEYVPSGVYYFQNNQTKLFMEVEAGTSYVEQSKLETTTESRWLLVRNADGYYVIRSMTSNKCIGIASTASGARVQQYNYSATNTAIQWSIAIDDEGNHIVKPRNNNTLALAVDASTSSDGADLFQYTYSSTDNYANEWNIIYMMPLSGSELVYDESLWNYIPVLGLTNCYLYAINKQFQVSVDGETVRPSLNPGHFYDMRIDNSLPDLINGYSTYLDTFDPYENIVAQFMMLDFEAFNILQINGKSYTCKPIGRYDQCQSGNYKISLVLSIEDNRKDYHFYRQDSDGFWSHKPGGLSIRRTDDSENLIVDPLTAHRGDYICFVSYYEITPVNNIYEPTNS